MPIIPLKCPCCGANIEADSDSPILSCAHCGTNSVMKDAIVQNYIQNTINISAGVVNVTGQKDFKIESGVLKRYTGELVDVVIPRTVLEIEENVFSGLPIRSVEIPDSVASIGDSAFAGCKSITSITIPGSVKVIGASAFRQCSSLTSLVISEGVKEIGYCAFQDCVSLTAVDIPASITKMGCYAFRYCSALTSATIHNPSALQSKGTFLETPLAARWKKEKRCPDCGGEVTGGFWSKTCSVCGRDL